MNPTIKIKNWHFMGNKLVGTAIGHPRLGTRNVITSEIQNAIGNKIYTKNSVYVLIGEPLDPDQDDDDRPKTLN